jgi:hypothetical protein
MRLIAFITRPEAIGKILTYLGEAITPPTLAPRARTPPEFDAAEWALTLDYQSAAGKSDRVRFDCSGDRTPHLTRTPESGAYTGLYCQAV